jgi:hypothetical protein
MANESIHNNPRDPTEERFVWLEEKVTDISCNMFLLMMALSNKLGPFGEARVSNSKIVLEGKSEDNEDPEKESRKELKK